MIAIRSSFQTFVQQQQRMTRPAIITAVRHLNVHEYVSMEIMQAHGISTPNCSVASTPEEAEQIFLHKLNQRKCKGNGHYNNRKSYQQTLIHFSFLLFRLLHTHMHTHIYTYSRRTTQRCGH